jgi:hypothetical protein
MRQGDVLTHLARLRAMRAQLVVVLAASYIEYSRGQRHVGRIATVRNVLRRSFESTLE